MYNPQKILDLLKERNVTQDELVSYLGLAKGTNLKQQLFKNIGVQKLEKIADFFHVPVDTFFDRANNGNHVDFSGEHQRFRNVNIQQDTQCRSLLALIEEKDKRIELLEQMLNIYKEKDKAND